MTVAEMRAPNIQASARGRHAGRWHGVALLLLLAAMPMALCGCIYGGYAPVPVYVGGGYGYGGYGGYGGWAGMAVTAMAAGTVTAIEPHVAIAA